MGTFIFFFSLISQSTPSEPYDADLEWDLDQEDIEISHLKDTLENGPALLDYSELDIPNKLDKARLSHLLQKFVDETEGIAFRHLGDIYDFYHGHILFDDETGEPLAILYHTQERAFYSHYTDAGGKYDYVNSALRNWIQFIDDGSIENAKFYKTNESKSKWNGFEQHFTIVSDMLDESLLGFDMAKKTTQWAFLEVPCDSVLKKDWERSNVIQIELHDQTMKCLAVEDPFYFNHPQACKERNKTQSR